jgi:hypothetical protein
MSQTDTIADIDKSRRGHFERSSSRPSARTLPVAPKPDKATVRARGRLPLQPRSPARSRVRRRRACPTGRRRQKQERRSGCRLGGDHRSGIRRPGRTRIRTKRDRERVPPIPQKARCCIGDLDLTVSPTCPRRHSPGQPNQQPNRRCQGKRDLRTIVSE